MGKSGVLWGSYAVVFLASACTMVLELVAGRLLAPYVGVSLYTWTSVIGVVLAGISLGNYLGGKTADRWPGQFTLGAILGASSLASFLVLGAAALLPDLELAKGFPLLARIVFLAAAIFFLPSCLMGMVSPVVVKLALRKLEETGNVVGKIYACSALGSIVGTFLTGFVLISLVGTRTIVVLVGVTLLAMAFSFGGLWRFPRWGTGTLGASVLVLGVAWTQSWQLSPCTRETAYYCLRVYDTDLPGGETVKTLVLDHLIHSYNSLEDPTLLVYGYLDVQAEFAPYATNGRPELAALFLGGGGYTLPRYLELTFPEAKIDVVEIDPDVTQTAHEMLGLSSVSRVVTYNEDARTALPKLQAAGKRYDVIYGDAFNDLSIPYHLTTREFAEAIRKLLNPEGLYVAMVIDHLQEGQFMRAYFRTLQAAFPYVHLAAEGKLASAQGLGTYLVVASQQPLDRERFQRQSRYDGRRATITQIFPAERVEAWLAASRPLILTDDYVPADNLVAPTVVLRGD